MDEPRAVGVSPATGALSPDAGWDVRRLSDLAECFADPAAANGDSTREVYRTSTAPGPARQGHLGLCLTMIRPGVVGREFHMTRGHVHRLPEGEVYVGQGGSGGVLMSIGGEVRWEELRLGLAVVIPPGWAHRSVNTGTDPFSFLAVFPALSGTDYEPVRRAGLGARVWQVGDAYEVVTTAGRTVGAGSLL